MPWQSSLQEGVITFTCNDERYVINTFSIDIPGRKLTIGPILPTLTAAEDLLTELNLTQPNSNWLNDEANISDQRIVIRDFTLQDILNLETIAAQPGVFSRVYTAVLARTAPTLIQPVTQRPQLLRQRRMRNIHADVETTSETRVYDEESSMLPLNQSELEILDSVKQHYAAAYDSLGKTEGIIERFKQVLLEYLTQNPLINPNDGRSPLPVNWGDLVKLNLDQDEAVLKVYYQSPHHTALRYFMRPNPWIAKDALFVNRDAEGNAWSNFGNDPQTLEIIALFWLAASDANEKPEGVIDTRFRQNLFFEAIAGLTRGHNLDEFQDRDDLKGDKPSCPDGVKQRLFNAVIAHSLFKNSTEKIISYDFGNYIRGFFKTKFDSLTDDQIKELFALTDKSSEQSCFVTGTYPENLKAILREINIPETVQREICEFIHNAFNRASADKKVKEYLLLGESPDQAHFIKLYKTFGLDDVLRRAHEARVENSKTDVKKLRRS